MLLDVSSAIKPSDGGPLAFCDAYVESRLPNGILVVHIGTAVDQTASKLKLRILAVKQPLHKNGVVVRVFYVQVFASEGQHVDHFFLVAFRRVHQRGEALTVFDVDFFVEVIHVGKDFDFLVSDRQEDWRRVGRQIFIRQLWSLLPIEDFSTLFDQILRSLDMALVFSIRFLFVRFVVMCFIGIENGKVEWAHVALVP